MALGALTYLIFGLFAGVLADRVRRRRIMVLADRANVVLIALPLMVGPDRLTTATSALYGPTR
jgi:MFS family permease